MRPRPDPTSKMKIAVKGLARVTSFRDVAALLPMTLFANSRDNDSADENHTDKDRRYDGTNYSLLIHWPGS
jgi:hypothetical protein